MKVKGFRALSKFNGLLKKLSDIVIKFYIKKLEYELMHGRLPEHIMVVADKSFDIKKFVQWCRKFKIKELTICMRDDNKKIESKFLDGIRVNFVIGYSGKDEIVDAVKEIARLVERRKIKVKDVDEKIFERFLKIKNSPDLIINVGNEIPEFLIWQSIYSELYFADISRFRYVDFLRCLRDYQRRERRYGR